MRKHAFTLVELLIAISCFALIMGPIYMLIRSGTESSVKGMKRVETTDSARIILKQVYADLKMQCFQIVKDAKTSSTFNFDSCITMHGVQPKVSYNFKSFSAREGYKNLFDNLSSNKNYSYRHAADITYRVEPTDDPKSPCFQLVREESIRGSKPTKQILSKKINFFEIKKINITKNELPLLSSSQHYYLITLQLIDAISQGKLYEQKGSNAPAEAGKNIILADYFDVVCPDFFRSAWSQRNMQPNWHTLLSDE